MAVVALFLFFFYKHLFLYRGLQDAQCRLMSTSFKTQSVVVGRWGGGVNVVNKTINTCVDCM